MTKINDFFSIKNTVNQISVEDEKQTYDYLEPIKAFCKDNL